MVPTTRLSVTSSVYARYGLYSGRRYRPLLAIGRVDREGVEIQI